MAKLLTGSINLSKIDKTKIVDRDKNGNPFENGSKFLNIVVWINDEPDNYGNTASIQIGQSKEEREAGVKSIYIGNLKEPQSRNNEPTSAKNAQATDDLPF
jgi:hypothetical protein